MGTGLFKAHLEAFDAIGAGTADKRREGYDKQYEYADAIKGAYGVFFFQHPSMLEYQERLKIKKQRSNIETILRVKKIPCNNQITRLLDDMDSGAFAPCICPGERAAAFPGTGKIIRKFLYRKNKRLLIF